MTAQEVRDYIVQPVSLAFAIVEHKIPVEEIKNFTGMEIRKIIPIATDPALITELQKQLKIKQNGTATI